MFFILDYIQVGLVFYIRLFNQGYIWGSIYFGIIIDVLLLCDFDYSMYIIYLCVNLFMCGDFMVKLI